MPAIRDFHAHIYFDPDELPRAQAVAAAAQAKFGVPVGHFHTRPVGPHPRGSCQLTVPRDQFGDFAQWMALNRDGLTIFAHTSTGEDLADHTQHVIWFDEEPPQAVYTECLMRTMTTEGIIYMIFTPLLGMTPLIRDFLADAERESE